MKITEIKIAPTNSWEVLSKDNPLRATVKLSSDKTTVETVLNDDDQAEIIALIEHVIARAAKRNVEQFVAAVSGGHGQLIEGDVK